MTCLITVDSSAVTWQIPLLTLLRSYKVPSIYKHTETNRKCIYKIFIKVYKSNNKSSSLNCVPVNFTYKYCTYNTVMVHLWQLLRCRQNAVMIVESAPFLPQTHKHFQSPNEWLLSPPNSHKAHASFNPHNVIHSAATLTHSRYVICSLNKKNQRWTQI